MQISEVIVVSLGGMCIGFLMGTYDSFIRRRKARRNAATRIVRRESAPPIERDGIRVTRTLREPGRRARVTTAHVSQRRSSWN